MLASSLPVWSLVICYDVIIPAQGEFGSDIPSGDRKLANLFYGVQYTWLPGREEDRTLSPNF